MGDLACWVPMLLHGRAGFVNESCGAYRSHEGTLTAASTANVRINDFYKLSNLIIVTAEENVCNPRLLNLIRRKLRRYLSRNVIGQLAMERRKGLSRRRCYPSVGNGEGICCILGPLTFQSFADPSYCSSYLWGFPVCWVISGEWACYSRH
jgi:hypothetical protein